MWAKGGNFKGRTLFLSHEASVVDTVRAAEPDLDIRLVNYDTLMFDAFTMYFDDEAKLMEGFPTYLRQSLWDVVVVDAPQGGGGKGNPGRMKSIYWASKVVAQQGHVFVHDAEREIERRFSERYLQTALGRQIIEFQSSGGPLLLHFPPRPDIQLSSSSSHQLPNSATTAGVEDATASKVSRTVVIAAALGYGLNDFISFIVPLRKVYSGDVVLFVEKSVPQNVKDLCNRLGVALRDMPTGSRLGAKGNRYIGYAEVCRATRYDWCFATDFRDVFFQADPFDAMSSSSKLSDLVFALEFDQVTIKKCPYNSDWIRTCWGDEFLSEIGHHTPICSGTIMGTPRGIEELRNAMGEEMSITASVPGCTARDQGHLNYLYHKKKFKVTTVVEPRGSGIVNTVGYITPRSTITNYLDNEGFVKQSDGTRYDRFPELNELLKRLRVERPSTEARIQPTYKAAVPATKPPAVSNTVSSSALPNGRSLKVVSFSLYGGNNRRYTEGAVANAKLMRTVYPGWEMRVYHDNSIPTSILDELRSFSFVRLVNMEGNPIKNQMVWRFLVASDSHVERYILRDIDSRISKRGATAVDDWIESGKKFHVMRDHPSHSMYSMSGGMWGGTWEAVPDMENRLKRMAIKANYLEDMNFLASKIWPIAQKSVWQHDAFSCDRFGGGHPFPLPREGWEHIGSVYIDGKMRQIDVDLLAKAKKPPKCTPTLKSGNTETTSSLKSSPSQPLAKRVFSSTPPYTVHETQRNRLFDLDAFKSIKRSCSKLNPGVFWECKDDANEAWLKNHQPCSDHAFIAVIEDGFVSDNRVHENVPGTVFTTSTIFKWQAYVRPVPEGHPTTWTNAPTLHEYDCIGTVLQAYPCEKGHFPHEVLPRLLYLLAHIPPDCSIVAAGDSFTRRYTDLLSPSDQARLVKWPGKGHIYHANKLYVANEGPYCDLNNPHNGGMSTFFQPDVVRLVRKRFVEEAGGFPLTSVRGRVVVIQRSSSARRYEQHDELVSTLETSGYDVDVFTASGSLSDHIRTFAAAAAVIAPHGAGLANLVFCVPGTLVVEIGWDGKPPSDVMEMDNMYSRLSAAMGLRYRLVVGHGKYGAPIAASVADVVEQLKGLAR